MNSSNKDISSSGGIRNTDSRTFLVLPLLEGTGCATAIWDGNKEANVGLKFHKSRSLRNESHKYYNC